MATGARATGWRSIITRATCCQPAGRLIFGAAWLESLTSTKSRRLCQHATTTATAPARRCWCSSHRSDPTRSDPRPSRCERRPIGLAGGEQINQHRSARTPVGASSDRRRAASGYFASRGLVNTTTKRQTSDRRAVSRSTSSPEPARWQGRQLVDWPPPATLPIFR